MDSPVLLTGASGRVGRAILDGINDEYDWHLLDQRPPDESYDGERFIGDITNESLVESAMEGVEVVIHLAGDPRPDAPWDSVLENNIHGTKVVLETAGRMDVQKVAFASSNHAVGAFETDERTPDMYRTDDEYRLTGEELPRPSNLYGVSKASGEVLGRYYHDHEDLSIVNVRIGNLTEEHPPIEYERGQAMWLSHRDCAHLFERTILADYDYEIVYGISDNDRKYYSLERAREVLDYRPQDNSAEYHFDGTPKDE